MIAIHIILVCLLAWTTASLVNMMTENNRQKVQDLREADRKRAVDILYGRVL